MGRGNILSVIVFAIALAVLPLVVRNTYYIGVLVVVAIYALTTIGLSLLMGYAGQISLGHAAFFGLGAYTSGLLTTLLGWNAWVAFAAATVFSALVGFIIAVPTLRLRGHYLAMATLGFGEIVYIVFNSTVDLTGGPSGFGSIPRLSIAGFAFDNDVRFYYLAWFFVLVVIVFSLNIIHSRVGRALRSIHGSEVAANAMGVNTIRYKVQVFVLSAMYASIGGSLYAHFVTFVSPSSFGLMSSILLVTMVVIGGMASIWGAILGAAILTFLPEYLSGFQDYSVLIYGLLLMVIMIFMPRGLFLGIADLLKMLQRPKEITGAETTLSAD
jgi:branched-chain amino acid transport system permease protein